MAKVLKQQVDAVTTQTIYVDKHDDTYHNVIEQTNFNEIASLNKWRRQHRQDLAGDNGLLLADIPYVVWDRWCQQYPDLLLNPNSRKSRRLLQRLLDEQSDWKSSDKRIA